MNLSNEKWAEMEDTKTNSEGESERPTGKWLKLPKGQHNACGSNIMLVEATECLWKQQNALGDLADMMITQFPGLDCTTRWSFKVLL